MMREQRRRSTGRRAGTCAAAVVLAAAVLLAAAALGACASGSTTDANSAPTSSSSAPGLTARERQAVITAPETEKPRRLRVADGFLTMSDGVRIAVTYYLPSPRRPGEKLPVVLSMTPYRKDDDGYPYSFAVYPYLAKRGIAVVQADVRGTGGSGGVTPDREYSDAELNDLVECVQQLADKPWSNGNVGMMGISWSGFNSLMTAMRRPPALKAILTAHASEDLYGNDVHTIDGCLHLDVFSLEMEVENPVPRSPGYKLDAAYFRERFARRPWVLTYLRHQRDGAWWQDGRSLRSDWSALDVPVYAIGALLDGYRDYVPHLLDNADVPVWAEIGPWNHAWPNDGVPAPDYEWRRTAVRWFKHWLTGDAASAPFEGKTLTVFQRGAVSPDVERTTTPGSFAVYDWPLKDVSVVRLTPQAGRGLAGPLAGAPAEPAASPTPATDTLPYLAGSGVAVGNWWGETTGDMRGADEHALVYDSVTLAGDVLVLGSPEVQLSASVDAPAADWFARLEDVWPDGRVSLVTGGGINGTQLASRTQPQDITPGAPLTLRFPLRFTSYTFAAGHRIRLAVTNAQFPMVWPSARRMTSTLRVGDASTWLDLPTIASTEAVAMPAPVIPYSAAPGSEWLASLPLTPFRVLRDDPHGITEVEESEGGKTRIGDRRFVYLNVIRRWVDNRRPARAGLVGRGLERIFLPHRTLAIRALVKVVSDEHVFHTTVRRSIYENGRLVRTRTWRQDVPRDHQ